MVDCREPGEGTAIDSEAGTVHSVLVDEVSDWLMRQALGDADLEAIFDGCCQRLDGAGVPVSRGMVTFKTLHPLYATVIIFWRRGQEVSTIKTRHAEAFTSEEFKRSPIHHMLNTSTPFLRRRLSGEAVQLDFPILEDLCAQGATDYLVYRVGFTADVEGSTYGDGIIGSWATARPGGFTEQEIHLLLRVQRRLAVACKMQIQREVTSTVLSAYLGHDAGQRVLRGQIRRGDGERIEAVIWYSDLRGSTPWAEALGPDEFLHLVNSYFECTAGAVIEEGGEVLRFIGDAVLAIFPLRAAPGRPGSGAASGDTPPPAERAIAALRGANARLRALNDARRASGQAPVECGIALHVGEVTFGNIGVPERVEFSVIGSAANEVARLESMTKTLGRPILVSGEFARLAGVDWEPMGEHALRGVNAPLEVRAPPAEF